MPKRIETQPHRLREPAAYSRMWRARNPSNRNKYARQYHARRMATDPAYREMKRVSARWSRRKRKYGLTREEYTKRLTEQAGQCSICGEQVGEALRVDHDHATGGVRGLLCERCNAGLGQFRDNVEFLRSAIRYLEHGKPLSR